MDEVSGETRGGEDALKPTASTSSERPRRSTEEERWRITELKP